MTEIIRGSEYLIKEVTKEQVYVPEQFDDEQKAMADMTHQFVHEEVMPDIEGIEKQDFSLVTKHLTKCGELGLLATDTPEEYGGLDLDKVTSMIIAEKIAMAGSFSVAFTAHTGIGTLPLVYYGTPEQKEQYLEKITSGEWFAAYCLTEPGSGSDALGAKATATLSEDGSHYILNGTKQFITNADFANLFTVFAKIDKEHFTAFLVERDFEGLSIGPEEKKMGIKGSSTCQVILEDCKVPVKNLLGEIGKGHKIAFNILNVGRFKLGSCTNGASKQVISEALEYANQRKQFGIPVSRFGALQEKAANMMSDLFASEALVYRLAGDLDANLVKLDKSSDTYYREYEKAIEDYAAECAITKVFCSEVLREIVDEGLQMYGGYGFVSEYSAERAYRDERINRIFEGTNEINRLLIPGTILKKAMKGELPLQAEAMKAFESLMVPALDDIDEEVPFAKEKKLLENLKKVFLILSGAAVQKYMDKLQREQEILMAAADIAIQIYAIESAVLRAEKAMDMVSEKQQKLMAAAVTSFTFSATEKLASAAKKCAYYVEEGDNLMMILSGIRRYTKYDATGLLTAKRELADAAFTQEKYIF